MRYGSVCSGIEAATAAWHPLGWRPSFFSEIEAFPRAVLAHHYPDVPLHGDFTTIEADQYEPIDLLVGGTPCQSFSVAGLRGGLDDDRGNLALEYLRLADRLRPRWLVWENVPGVLSSNGGRDFGAILGGMVELGYGVAYRVLDAQFFGLAQRRKRVFVVGYLGDWRRAAAVLFERHSLSGNPAPRREAGQKPAPTISARPTGGGGLGTDFDLDGGLIATPLLDGAKGRTDKRGSRDGAAVGNPGDPMFTLREGSSHAVAVHAIQAGALRENASSGPNGVGVQSDHAYTLEARAEVQVVAYSIMPQNSGKDYKARPVDVAQPVMAGGPVGGNQGGDYIVQPYTLMERGRQGAPNLEYRQDGVANAILTPNGGRGGLGVGAVAFNTRQDPIHGDAAQPLGAKDNGHGLLAGSAVRRLTPRECERLQGFPDDYTLIPWRKGMASDGPRYKALGNSFAVPVVRWIGERIQNVEAACSSAKTAA